MRAVQTFDISERRACKALGLNRSGIRYIPKKAEDEDELREMVVAPNDFAKNKLKDTDNKIIELRKKLIP